MPERFPQLALADVSRARTNLALIEQRLPAKLWQVLPTLLGQVPDPDGALNYLERYLRDDGREALDRTLRYIERNPAALHYLLLVFSYSRFLSETLVQQPELAEWLHRPTRTRNFRGGIERVKSDEDLDEEFARFEATALDIAPSRILARFKRREYLRIMLRDVLGLATLADTTLEISQLADLLLRRALRTAEQRLQALYGAPQFTDAADRTLPASFIVLALGKLGAQELNYASDVDLMFLYDNEGQTSGGSQGHITNSEYFIRLAHAVLKLVTEITPEGAVFRVDVRLRPQGTEGFIAISIPAAVDYYRTRAREWELQMLIKARPAAGNAHVARAFFRDVHQLVFRPEFNLAAVEAVLNAREEMTRSLGHRGVRGTAGHDKRADHASAWNVKLSPGGIRDIEFLVQCLQRLHGGTDPWLAAAAAAPTLVALQRLHDKGHLTGHDFFRLGAAYQFLRVVEHRLQLRDGLQRHTLPGADAIPPGALDRLARRCGIEAAQGEAAANLLARISQHFADVRETYHRLILPHRSSPPAAESIDETPGSASSLLTRFAHEYPAVTRAAREALATGDPFARRGLDRYLTTAALETAVMQDLEQHVERIPLAAKLFARSDLAVEMLSRQAEDIRLLDDLAHPLAPPPAIEQRALFPERLLGTLRSTCRRRLFEILARAALGLAKPFEAFLLLSQLADWGLTSIFPLIASSQASQDKLDDTPLAVLALGRLGTGEMDFGSDADLVFITADGLSPQQREPWRRVAEQYIHTASSQTREGNIVPVDTRLRPQGSAGDIVVSASALCGYLAADAQAWEAITWLKARPIAGNLKLGQEVVGRARQTLTGRWSTPEAQPRLREQLAALRARMEREGTGLKARGEFKHLPGSIYDIEYLLSLLAFRHGLVGGPSRQQGAPANILHQIAALQAAGALDPAAATTLHSAAELYRSADHAHRVITGTSPNRPPEPALAHRLAVLLQTWGILPTASADALEQCLHRTRAEVRHLYQKEFAHTGPAELQ